MRWPWPVALAGSAVTGALVLAGGVLAALQPTSWTIAWAAVGGAAAVLCAVLGTLVARRVRGNPVGALLVLVGVGVALTAARQAAFTFLAHHPQALARLDWLVALTAESSAWLFVALALLLLFFPNG